MQHTVSSPTLPLIAGGPLTLVALFVLILLIRTTASRATILLLVAIWLRYVLSAFPAVALFRLPVGVTVNAVASLTVIGAGLLVLSRRTVPMLAVPPVAAICALIVLSGLINGNLGEGIDSILKYAYFLILIFAIVEAADDLGFSNLLTRLLPLFLVPLMYQMASYVMGVAKASEADGSASYIGGYGHESAFSIVLITGMLVAALNRRLSGGIKLALIALFAVCVLLANYRTSMLAMLPFLATLAVIGVGTSVVMRQRALALGVGLSLVLGAAALAPQVAGDRFDTLTAAFDEGSDLFKSPNEYSREDKRLMSGRAFFWATYYEGFATGTPRQQWFGHGQDSWQDVYRLYAHNTLFSQIYELGICGVVLMCGLWAWMLGIAVRVGGTVGPLLVSANLSFVVLNMATMPLWQIEGIIFYAVICGASFHYLRQRRMAAEPSESPIAAQARLASTRS